VPFGDRDQDAADQKAAQGEEYLDPCVTDDVHEMRDLDPEPAAEMAGQVAGQDHQDRGCTHEIEAEATTAGRCSMMVVRQPVAPRPQGRDSASFVRRGLIFG
jgi:hypothetical protein